jgi:hypothetical protein
MTRRSVPLRETRHVSLSNADEMNSPLDTVCKTSCLPYVRMGHSARMKVTAAKVSPQLVSHVK